MTTARDCSVRIAQGVAESNIFTPMKMRIAESP